MGIGGSVIFSTKRGSGMSADGEDEQYFTAAVIGSVILAALAWVGLILFERPLLMFFGTDETLLALAQRYMIPVKVVFPLFLFNQMLAAFLRNDGAPALATLGVLSGGIFNVLGDWFFVFPCDMGVYGAGLATALGSAVSFLVMLTHFASRKNTLRLVKPKRLARKLWKISVTGFSSSFIDMAMGILTVLFNRQIMQYLGSDALAIYGPIINVSTFVQCCAYSVGQAAQPIISTNYGAGKGERIKETLHLGAADDGVFRRVLYGAEHGVPERLHPHFHGAHAGDTGYGARHHQNLCAVVLAASVQHLLDLLFPGDHEAEGSVRCFCGTGTCHQRHFDHGSSCAGQRRCDLVCDASHGAAGHALRRFDDPQIHKGFAGRYHLCRSLPLKAMHPR